MGGLCEKLSDLSKQILESKLPQKMMKDAKRDVVVSEHIKSFLGGDKTFLRLINLLARRFKNSTTKRKLDTYDYENPEEYIRALKEYKRWWNSPGEHHAFPQGKAPEPSEL